MARFRDSSKQAKRIIQSLNAASYKRHDTLNDEWRRGRGGGECLSAGLPLILLYLRRYVVWLHLERGEDPDSGGAIDQRARDRRGGQ